MNSEFIDLIKVYNNSKHSLVDQVLVFMLRVCQVNVSKFETFTWWISWNFGYIDFRFINGFDYWTLEMEVDDRHE